MALLKEYGSLDVERINKLPLEEYMDAIGDLSEEQYEEYLSKLPINEFNEPIRVIKVDRPMGVNSDDVINNIGKRYDSNSEMMINKMKDWSAEEQAQYLCPNGVMTMEEFRRLGHEIIDKLCDEIDKEENE